MDLVTTQDWLVSIKSPLELLNSDSADTQVSKESSPLLDPQTSIFLDVILILSYITLIG